MADLAAGVYHYQVAAHALTLVAPGDLRAAVARASLHQSWMTQAPVMVVITGEYRRCTGRYGERGVRYTHMEAGNVSQNLFLAAEAQGLGAGIVGAFEDKALAQAMNLAWPMNPSWSCRWGINLRGKKPGRVGGAAVSRMIATSCTGWRKAILLNN